MKIPMDALDEVAQASGYDIPPWWRSRLVSLAGNRLNRWLSIKTVSINQDRGWEGGLTPLTIGDLTSVSPAQCPRAAPVPISKGSDACLDAG